jgi:hypothetical protein
MSIGRARDLPIIDVMLGVLDNLLVFLALCIIHNGLPLALHGSITPVTSCSSPAKHCTNLERIIHINPIAGGRV